MPNSVSLALTVNKISLTSLKASIFVCLLRVEKRSRFLYIQICPKPEQISCCVSKKAGGECIGNYSYFPFPLLTIWCPAYQIGQLEGKPEITTTDEKKKVWTCGMELSKNQWQISCKEGTQILSLDTEPFSQKRESTSDVFSVCHFACTASNWGCYCTEEKTPLNKYQQICYSWRCLLGVRGACMI